MKMKVTQIFRNKGTYIPNHQLSYMSSQQQWMREEKINYPLSLSQYLLWIFSLLKHAARVIGLADLLVGHYCG